LSDRIIVGDDHFFHIPSNSSFITTVPEVGQHYITAAVASDRLSMLKYNCDTHTGLRFLPL
jgi:hypothetical protein